MQDKKWVRVGLATLILGGAFGCVSAAGCGSSSSGGVGPTDSGADHTNTDSGSSSGGMDSGGKDVVNDNNNAETSTPPNANVYLVNAVVDPKAPPAFRFCFGIPSAVDGGPTSVVGTYTPLPDYKESPIAPVAGLPQGYGGNLSANKVIEGINLAALSLKVYAINAANPLVADQIVDGGPDGGAEAYCQYFIGSDGLGATSTGTPNPKGVLTLGTDYWPVGEITKGQLASGTTWLAALTGCVPGETDNNDIGLCGGAAYSSANGNLSLQLMEVDSTTKLDGGSLGAQFAQVSIAWDAYMSVLAQGAAGTDTTAGFYIPPTIPDAGPDSGDAGDAQAAPPPGPTFIPISQSSTFGTLKPAALAPVAGITFDGNSGFFAQGLAGGTTPIMGPPNTVDGGACVVGQTCASPWLMPLPTINELTQGLEPDGGMPPNEFANGAGYVFVLVGSPAAPPYVDFTTGQPCNPLSGSPTCVFNGQFTHFLAFPTL